MCVVGGKGRVCRKLGMRSGSIGGNKWGGKKPKRGNRHTAAMSSSEGAEKTNWGKASGVMESGCATGFGAARERRCGNTGNETGLVGMR